ncbi:hypothetical protein PENTCL1PPCAC_30656 [Pristionchus entomophagus]|uniref:TBC1 domain family member 15 n=1 Tax=Pristionchus entomophagus TaxID=358040 RepID=A0AAV5UN62_9BILA|nr:hypothetical protein PENTCL1PPCAC_5739 [Pristionchus entomophagus]GMT08482.1 hypothetical protein PENTCL1PPCAC_30656 [Pristionchus entomophagus]
MLPYLAYKYVKDQKEKNKRDMQDSLANLTVNLSKSISPDMVALRIPGVSAKLTDDADDQPTDEYIPGTLAIVEKATGVFIEWTPQGEDECGWVLADDDAAHTIPQLSPKPVDSSSSALPSSGPLSPHSRLRFSVDVNDLSSFKNVEPKKGKGGHPCVRLIAKDGTNYVPLFFLTQSTKDFIDVLQRYVVLRRSAREHQLVLVVDEKAEALAQSLSTLDQNGDIMGRFMHNPYATAMTGLSKITTFVQDQVIPAILDSDAVSQEEKIRAMRELRTETDDTRLKISREADFEVVTQLELPPRPDIYRESSVTQSVWSSFKQSDGSFDPAKSHHLMMNVFRGGVETELRKEAWKYLLGYYEWSKTPAENEKKRAQLEKDYLRMKGQWQSISEDQESRFAKYVVRKALVEKDVARTDRTLKFFAGDENPNLAMLNNVLMTYCMYDFDLGYVQGMSDFCSPLLYVMGNECDAFWCFVGFMERVHANFEKDQTAIKVQLNQLRDILMIVNPKLANYLESHDSDDMYFCFRWLIVWFKREFSFEDTCKLWEVLWTCQPCPNFLLLICAATLDRQTETIIENKFGLTEILKHVNDLSMHHDLDEMLTSAEAIFHQLSASQDKLPMHICEHLALGDKSVVGTPSGDDDDDE